MILQWLDWAVVLIGYIIALLLIYHIVMQRREPTATLAWALGMLLVPYIGAGTYLVFGRHRLKRQVRRRKVRAAELEPRLVRVESTGYTGTFSRDNGWADRRPAERDLVRLANRIGCRGPTAGNRVTLLVNAHQAYDAMEAAIVAATDHVHFQFYIFQTDETGKRFRDLLTQKAREGVAVRVLTDGVGSYGADHFMAPLIKAGGQFAEFLPVNIFSRHWHPNLRNHRKLVVVDGRIAFTGGVNIGDEYVGKKKKIAHWRDTHICIEGPAVQHIQEVFAEDWYFCTDQEPDDTRWFPEVPPLGDLIVQVVSSGPDTDTQPIQRMFFTAVTSARERVWLTTPYFVPDQAMLVALQTAALRGVDVRLLLPNLSDMELALHAGRSYYDELMEAGVRIFEYMPGILHAKALVVDDRWATVGSANMDVRSFRLNFEINVAVYGPGFAQQLATLFQHDLDGAHEITAEDLANRPTIQRMAEGLARAMSPLL